MMTEEIKVHLQTKLIPFWKKMRDQEYGGYYGFLDYDLHLERQAVKGCILNSRIIWFFANAYTLLGEPSLLEEARHGYKFLKNYCLDKEYGGIYWALNYDGTLLDTTKHTYNQAFAIYALSSYYEASGDKEALELAQELFRLIEQKCTDEVGYLEAFTRTFKPEPNEKLSENGVLAEKTMNTLLHVFEAYTELYRVSGSGAVREKLEWILKIVTDKIYNAKLRRQEVFFDNNYNSILNLHSYGHDIEAAWLIDRGLEVLGGTVNEERIMEMTNDLTAQIYREAFDGHSLANESENGVVNTHRIWWVQAEAIVGFLNGYQKNPAKTEYLHAAECIWNFISEHLIDRREGSEWYWEVDEAGRPFAGRPIVEPWKCPYHNGRMCMEVIKRLSQGGANAARSVLSGIAKAGKNSESKE